MIGVWDTSSAPWRHDSSHNVLPVQCSGAEFLGRVKPIPAAIASELASRELIGIVPSSASIQLLKGALELVDHLPDLASILYTTVSDIHLLSAQAGYDISHSEPRWRRSIFVSLPDRTGEIGALRMAESVVHEAMHLHLTNREQLTQFVAAGHGEVRSPWRDEPRPFQGVLHGLYVFSCLSWFFNELLVHNFLGITGRTHAARRLSDISLDVQSIDLNTFLGGLTEAGAKLARRCVTVAMKLPALAASVSPGGSIVSDSRY